MNDKINLNPLGIKILKLVNGQEIIADILDMQQTYIEIKNPRVIHIEVDKDTNAIRIGFPPISMFTEDEKFILNPANIFTIFSPVSNLENAYRQHTSGIVLANENQLNQLNQEIFKQ
jgi:hypothetical protein